MVDILKVLPIGIGHKYVPLILMDTLGELMHRVRLLPKRVTYLILYSWDEGCGSHGLPLLRCVQGRLTAPMQYLCLIIELYLRE